MTNKERAELIVKALEHGSEEHRQLLRAVVTPSIHEILDEAEARGRKQGLIEAAAIANHVFDPMDPEAWPARKAAETILAQASKKGEG